MSARRKPDPGSKAGFGAGAEQVAVAPHGPGTAADAVGMDADALRRVSEEIARDFSPEMDRTALVLYDLDPENLQAQWYVSAEDAARALRAFPGNSSALRLRLRLCRREPEQRTRVVATAERPAGGAPYRGQESFVLAGGGASYDCELGLESGDGGWLMMARSNRIRLEAANRRPEGIGTRAGEAGARDSHSPPTRAPPQAPVEAALAAAGGTLTPVFPNPGPVIEPPAVQQTAGEAQVAGGDSAPGATPGAGRFPKKRQGAGAGPSQPVFSATAPPQASSDTDYRTRRGDVAGPRYDPRAALSSAALRPFRPRRADLEVRAELVVRGRGIPGSRVVLFGLPVRVGADGRFTIRRTVDAALLSSLAGSEGAAPKSGVLDEE